MGGQDSYMLCDLSYAARPLHCKLPWFVMIKTAGLDIDCLECCMP